MKMLYGIKRNLTGQVFGRLTVMELAPKKWGNNSWWLCKCSCGKENIVCSSDLLKGSTNSCGCLRREATHSITHGLTGTKFQKTWKYMNDRCTQKGNASYPRYGAKGIKVLWNNIESFRDDMYQSFLKHVEKYGERNTTIDRIDSGKNYCKENCRWATYKEQANNRKYGIV